MLKILTEKFIKFIKGIFRVLYEYIKDFLKDYFKN
jgi:hypothetical protein